MKLVELNEKDFKNFADKQEQITFHQTKQWAHLKIKNGWKAHYLGLIEEDKLNAAALILSKSLPIIKKKIFYSPRGFLIDYNNFQLLKNFTVKIKEYAKKNNAIFIKIDPYVEYKERDIDGNLVKNGMDNSTAINNLKKLGYKHFGFNIMQDSLQPRWMHVIETKDRGIDDIMKEMESKTRQIIRKNERNAVKCREITKDELKIFKHIMQHTSNRREFVDRPLSYYENMWNSLHEEGILKVMVAEIDLDEFEINTRNEIDIIKKDLDDRIYKNENNILKMNNKKFDQSNKKDRDSIKRLENQLEKIKSLKEEYGNKALLGGILFLIYGREVLSLYGGSLSNLMQFQSAYTLHFEGIKYAIENNYDRYNFYGITGDFRKENPLYGLYLFKKSFGGHVVELIGEFDLSISNFWYKTYKIAFGLYHKIKNIKNHN